jgi:hypothetical protein
MYVTKPICPMDIMPNTQRLIGQSELLQIRMGGSRQLSMRGLPVNEAAISASIVIDLHTTLYTV